MHLMQGGQGVTDSYGTNDLQLRGLQRGVKSSLVPARKPSMRPARCCIRLSRVFTSAVSWPMSRLARLARDLFRTDRTLAGRPFLVWAGGPLL